MSSKPVSSFLPFATICTMLSSSLALAQENSAEPSTIEEITVTATKREQSIYEVPIAISAFSGDALASQGITDLTDVGKFVPNLNITGFSAGHTSSANPFIRGIGLQDHLITTDPGVSVYVDGVYLGRQVGQNWNLNNIERIEVLRGPQGTLYGRNSIGGAINIITKEPDTDGYTRVSVEGGTRGRIKTDFFANHGVNENLAFNINLGYNERDGVGDFINVPDAEYDVGELEEMYGRFSVKYTQGDFSLVATADGNNGKGGLRPYTTLILPGGALDSAGYTQADITRDAYDNATGNLNVTEVRNNARGLSVTANWDFSDTMAAKAIYSNRSSDYKAGLDDDSLFDDFLSFPEEGKAEQTSIELQLNGDFGSVDFVSGLYAFEEDGSNRQPDAVFNGGPSPFFLEQNTTSQAVFVNVGFDITDQFRLSGGLRYTEDEKDVTANVFDVVGNVSDTDSWDELTWELAANYTLDNGINFYGTIQTGYQSGQYPARPYCIFGDFGAVGGFDALGAGDENAIAAAVAAVQANNCVVASDNITAVNYEAGMKGSIGGILSMSIAVFNTEYEELPYQVSSTSGVGFTTTNQIVEQTSRGVEWESTVYFNENFTLHTSLGYIDVEVEKQNNVRPVAPLTPELTASISPSYTHYLNSGKIIARLDYSFRDSMYGEPSDLPGRFTEIDSREITNFDIAYKTEDEAYTIALYGRNIFDERYDNARLNTGDYVLQILNNDLSEFGVRLSAEF
ncbi:TonB-dependent receptor [Marinibactrum halimedae]|uniref:TonB-dependent receptor n=1 Tax=Marinibactrum halimedae TaxID=1444977 RepID=A0AA37TDC4_9GAMM|nr:TonB-dependent receptor [Marinibactrum halimedae]MCD9457984.1 TonB-dependent receptor [Marinibactrum halimedae]GLS27610.1 TonB-dependent receptor [Marinibactrum halimedae]